MKFTHSSVVKSTKLVVVDPGNQGLDINSVCTNLLDNIGIIEKPHVTDMDDNKSVELNILN